MRKKLTIVIPTYNRKRYLESSLNHLLPQITEEVELIISDNASTDGTFEFVKEIKKKYTFIRYFRYKEMTNLNLLNAFRLATGRYLLILCDDDIALDNCVSNILNCIDEHKDIGLIKMNTTWFNGTYTGNVVAPVLKIDEDIFTYDKDVFINTIGPYMAFISSMVYHVDNIRKVKNIRQYIKTSVTITHVAMRSLKGVNEMAIIKEPWIAGRGGNIRLTDIFKVYVEDWKYFLYTTGIEAGCSKRGVRKSYIKNLNNIVKYYVKKSYSLDVEGRAYDISNRKVLLKHTWMYPSVWIQLYPYVFLPEMLRSLYESLEITISGLIKKELN